MGIKRHKPEEIVTKYFSVSVKRTASSRGDSSGTSIAQVNNALTNVIRNTIPDA